MYSLNIDNFHSIFHAHVHLQTNWGTLMMTEVFLLTNDVFFLKSLTCMSIMEASPEPRERWFGSAGCTLASGAARVNLPSNCRDIPGHSSIGIAYFPC